LLFLTTQTKNMSESSDDEEETAYTHEDDRENNNDEKAKVTCDTTKGKFTMHFIREWSPIGYDRALKLFENGFYDNTHFFRCIHGFLVQFGISYTKDDELKNYAYNNPIKDDPHLYNPQPIKFTEGIISFAGNGRNSRTSHLFIAYDAIPSLGRELWETPIGYVGKEDMDNVIWKLYDGYGDENGPEQWKLMNNGKSYIDQEFPLLDSFLECKVTRYDGNGNGNLDRRELLEDKTRKFDNEWNYMHYGADGEPIVIGAKESNDHLDINVVLILFFGFISGSVLLIKNRNKIWKKE